VNAPGRRDPTADLADRELTYVPVGATRPDEPTWPAPPAGFRAHERTVVIGDGPVCWEAATSALMTWGVKTRSGFVVEAGAGAAVRVREGAGYWLVAALGPISVREPVRIVAVVDRPDRCGFAYGTLQGHPVSGEEAFVAHRTPDGTVRLTLRSLTRAPRGAWRAAFPGALVAQRWYRRRYVRALGRPPSFAGARSA
jgi:uncharacterized protein (UPF0548 family)